MDVVVLLGAPGSGKGTAAARVVRKLGLTPIASGDMLRDAVARQTAAGIEASRYMNSGELVPDALIGRMISDLIEAGSDQARYLLDGFPRTVPQMGILDAILADCGGVLKAAVVIEVADAVVTARLAGRQVCPACKAVYHVATLPPKRAGVCDACAAALVQRTDDLPETIAQRLAVYHRQTEGVIDAYAARGVLKRVDGVGGVDAVAERMTQALK